MIKKTSERKIQFFFIKTFLLLTQLHTNKLSNALKRCLKHYLFIYLNRNLEILNSVSEMSFFFQNINFSDQQKILNNN